MDGEDDDDEDGDDDEEDEDDEDEDDDDYDTKVCKPFFSSNEEYHFYTLSSFWVCFDIFLFSSLEQKTKGTAGGEGQQGERPAECKQQ